ncbi:DUF4291 family protein [Treponema zioleckii]|uniref:DUF4291 family protein n=1 Tax=Treponema zioleckii TaxID=331680 RepID=UPI00168B79B3|nr:DUF4291 family protein [Treponema zioleckii]
MEECNFNQIRAIFDEESVRVYQAYNDKIADEALRRGTFGSNFSTKRMTKKNFPSSKKIAICRKNQTSENS